jgi:hypothetical protein
VLPEGGLMEALVLDVVPSMGVVPLLGVVALVRRRPARARQLPAAVGVA